MNEEEKKIIEKFVEKCNKFDESVEIKGVSVGEEYRILETVCKVLDLVEKLQKENETKEKIVDDMADWLYKDDTSFGYGKLKEVNTKERIVKFFENKTEQKQ